jgi:ketosteroid isomerase-like protein
MSRENVELVRRGFMAALEEDWPAALETLHPEVEIHDFDIPDAGLYRGRDGFLAWRDAVTCRIDDGQIVRMEYFNDRRRALDAVGLTE